MNTVLFVNATIGFSENLFLVENYGQLIFMTTVIGESQVLCKQLVLIRTTLGFNLNHILLKNVVL